ncbi:MAG: HAMP domain-containing histidine kinase [Bacteroidales bacterium]|nr:HAMP domain-containing histidine kinase [Bacteroidales bacterium]
MSDNNKRYFTLTISFLVAFLFSVAGYFYVQHLVERESDPVVVKQQVEQRLLRIQSRIRSTDSLVHHLLQKQDGTNWKLLEKELGSLYTSVVIQKGDSLVYWNNTHFPNQIQVNPSKGIHFISDKTGWYISENQYDNTYFIHYFYKLQDRYSGHTDVLSEYLKDYFLLPHRVRFVSNIHQPDVVKLDHFKVGFIIEKGYNSPNLIIALFFLYVLGYVLLFYTLYFLYISVNQNNTKIKSYHLLVFAFLNVVILRGADVYFDVPHLLKQTFLFRESVLTLNGFSTLGDLILNLVLLTVFILHLRQRVYISDPHSTRHSNLKGMALLFFAVSVVFGLYELADFFLIGFDQQYFLNDAFFSLLGFSDLFFIAFLGMLTFLVVDMAARFIAGQKRSLALGLLYLLFPTLILWIIFRPEVEIMLMVFIVVLVVFLLAYAHARNLNTYVYTLIILIVLSLSGAVLLNHTQLEVRNAHQKITASIISQKNDPYLEFTFKSLSKKILSDSVLESMVYHTSSPNEQQVSKYIDNTYLKGYFGKYSKQITLCRPGQELQIQPGNQIMGCDEFFSQIPGKIVFETKNFSLKLIQNYQENIYYLAKFSFPRAEASDPQYNLYLELFADFVPTSIGYPFKTSGENTLQHLSGYSFAHYQGGKLQYKFGDFIYPVDFSYLKEKPHNRFFYLDNYKHIIVPSGDNDFLIVSRPQDSFSVWLLPFSELFLLLSLFLLVYIVINYGGQVLSLLRNSFRTRLQLIFFSSVLFVFVFLSVIALYYFNENNRIRISDYLKEKTHSVLIEMQHKFSGLANITPQDKMEIQMNLQKFSDVFFSDINLYDRNGKLIASSNPQIFEKGEQSEWMNPQAYFAIQEKHQLFYLSKERLGRTVFYSSYIPLTLMDGKEGGIINLPYFARQNEIQHSYYQMLANLLNLFVITGILGMIIMMYLSRILTKPLRLLHDKINLVSIEKKNEKIVWKDRDEIGQLIGAYNQMVEKLEESAELLKYTERERAWREMARQITHEIRNPLTPMKLNVQYLQKAYEQKDAQFDEKLKNISETLISQIDTLNEVAGMFSDFSKSAAQDKTTTANLLKALNENISFFKKSFHVEFNLMVTDENIWVRASQEDLIRIFNNLTKNAIQAMEHKENKQIDISINVEKELVAVLFRDYGPGIARKNRDRIFQPYFTTKSTGTGLGLAIVRNLMREWEGSVSFDSEPGAGTTFILRFKKVSPEQNDS